MRYLNLWLGSLILIAAMISCGRRPHGLPPASKTLIYPEVEVPGLWGRVVRDGTQEGLPGVIVEVFLPNSDKMVRKGMTNNKGHFRFALPQGSYVLQFSKLGFDRVRQPVQTNRLRGQQLELGLPLGT